MSIAEKKKATEPLQLQFFHHQFGDGNGSRRPNFDAAKSNNRGGGKGPHSARRCEMTEWRHGASKSPSFFSAFFFFAVPSRCRVSVAQKQSNEVWLSDFAGGLAVGSSVGRARRANERTDMEHLHTSTTTCLDSYSFTFIQMKLEMNMKNIVHSTLPEDTT